MFAMTPLEKIAAIGALALSAIVACLSCSGCAPFQPTQTTNPTAEAQTKALEKLAVDQREAVGRLEAQNATVQQTLSTVVANQTTLIQNTQSTQTNIFDLSPRQAVIVEGVAAGVASLIMGLMLVLLFLPAPSGNPLVKGIGLAVGGLMMLIGPAYAIIGIFVNPAVLP